MATRKDDIFKQAMLRPGKMYQSPRDVVQDSRLSALQKKEILQNWEEEQKSLLVADEENMPAEKPKDSNTAVILQAISSAREDL